MDIHSRSTEYLQRIASIRQKHRSLYEVEVYVVLLCIIALAVFVCLRGGFVCLFVGWVVDSSDCMMNEVAELMDQYKLLVADGLIYLICS